MIRTRLLLVGLAVLGACAGAGDRPDTTSGLKLSKSWLIGGWVLAGESCESDGGVLYQPNGSWVAEGAAGTWRVEDGRLFSTVTDEESDGGETSRLDPPIAYSEDVELKGADAFVARRDDGTVRRMERCPARGA
jgi:hypothetical protein